MRVEARETVDQILPTFYTTVIALIALCQNKGTAMRHHNNNTDDPVY